MIPLRDTIKSDSFPLVNWILIILNAVVFFFEISLDHGQAELFIQKYGLIPAETNLTGNNSYRFFTNMFLHGGWWHFIGNMWILYIFGDNVEDKMGRFRYLIFYLLTGLLAGLTHFILYRNSPVPAIGASGAISGVMAAYMFMFPGSMILSFVPIFIIPLLIPIPALIYIGIWFIGQLFSGTYSLLLSSTATGIAFWAHIGGFIAGIILYRIFVRKKKNKKYYSRKYQY